MEYTRKVTDLDTGEVRKISIGEHLTFTEAADKLQVMRSSLIKVLLHLGVCQKEYDPVARENRHRLKPEAQEKGLGYRIMGEHGPFDVLSPTAMAWLKEDLNEHLAAPVLDPQTVIALGLLHQEDQTRISKLDVEGKVRWLFDHFPRLPVVAVAKGLGVSRELVHRYLAKCRDQLRRQMEKRLAPLHEKLEWPEDDLREDALKAFKT
ncbi:hypothetical protein [Thalassospira marina]|uniref:Uncharacterized protein n=1 Tax=Thalassospira marina TaxID=2048283 RepID=A0A2N3KU74_9PROT|nr:hypothetical protein [Thalassospira marina]PKR54046.1 hypothetical protein COO20_10845 [Thalassospira marina]